MTLEQFAQQVPGLSALAHVEKIKHFAWFLLAQGQKDRISTTDVRDCYSQLHYALPGNPSSLMKQMAEKDPPDLLRDSQGYRLEGRVKEQLDGKYSQRPAAIAVDAMLQSLPGRVSDEAEKLFLSEALTCYRNKAFRATIVMTWNLAYDHLLNWVLANHLAAFNTAIPQKFQNPKRAAVRVHVKDDFEEFKESEVIDLCGTGGIINDNTKKILVEKLTKRNMAAHPSLIAIIQYQAEDVISDLVNNVILKLT